jgi:hypothetical protein
MYVTKVIKGSLGDLLSSLHAKLAEAVSGVFSGCHLSLSQLARSVKSVTRDLAEILLGQAQPPAGRGMQLATKAFHHQRLLLPEMADFAGGDGYAVSREYLGT